MKDSLRFAKKAVSIAVTATTIAWSIGLATFAPLATQAASAGSLIKQAGNSSVYYLGSDNKRYVFPNQPTYNSWYPDFSGVQTITSSELQSYPIGGNVTMRAGTKLVKITTDPKVYAVEPGGTLRWLSNESVAQTLYGDNWAKRVVDVPDAFFVNYKPGSDITSNTYPTGTLVKSASSSDIYYVDGSSKRKVTSAGMTANLLQASNVVTAQDSVFNALSTGTDVTAQDATIWNVSGGAGVGPGVGQGSGLTVALASDTPASTVQASGTAYNPALKVNLTASADGPVNVTAITITRQGVTLDSDFAGIGVFDASGRRHGNFVSFANTKATVSFSSDPIIVPAGQTVGVWVKTNITTTPASGTYALSITKASDVATSATVNGSFPVSGNGFSLISGSTAVGALTADAVLVLNNGVNDATPVNINLGTTGQEVGRFRFAAGPNEDVVIKKITMYNSGNANDGDVTNIKLVGPDGAVLATVPQTTNRYVTFDLSAAPYKISKGNTRDFSVRVDVVSGSTRTVRFVIENDYDIEVVGNDTGSGILATAAASVDGAFPIGDSSGGGSSCTSGITCINKITINSGTLLFAKAGDAPSGNIAAGANSIVLGKWEVTPQGEDMELRKIQYNVNSASNLSGTFQIKVDGSTVYSVTGTSANTATITTNTYTLSSYPVIHAGTKSVITAESSISSTATNGATVVATLDITQVKRISTNDLVDPAVSATAANTLTISTAALSVSTNASFPNTTVVSGLSQAKVGSFNLTASSTEDVSLASITVGLTNNTNVSNLMLCISSCSTGQLGSTITSPSTSNVVSLTGVTIPRGSSKTVDVYVTTNSSTTGTEIASLTALSATGSSSSATVTATGLTATGQTITFSGAGTLTLALDTTNTPVGQILHSGQVDVPLLAIRVTSNNAEAIKLSAVQVSAVNGNTSLEDLKLFNGSTQVGSTVKLTNGAALFSDFSTNGLLTVPQDNTLTLWVKGSTTASGSLASQATDNLSLDYVEAIGASGGSKIKPGTTLSTTWSATNITAAGASISVADTTGFHRGDVVFAYDGTNGGTLGIVTAEPTSTTAMTVSGLSAKTFAGSATISKIESGATTAVSSGTSGTGTANVQYTVTTTKGFTVNDPVIINGPTTSQLGYVVSVDSSTLITIQSMSATSTGSITNGNISKIGTDTVGTTTTASAAQAPTATTVGSNSGFSVGDLVLYADAVGGNGGTFCIVTAVSSTNSMTLGCNAAVTATGTSHIVRVGSANPATTLVSTAVSAGGNRVIAATSAGTVTDTTGFGAADTVVTIAATGGAILGKVGTVTNSSTMTIASAAASATAITRVSRLPGAASAGKLVTFHDVEPTITPTSGFSGGAAVGNTTQEVGKFDIKADGDRNLNFTALAVDVSGSNAPSANVTTYKLYNGATLLSQASSTVATVTQAGAQALTSGTTLKLCAGTPAAANEIGLGSAGAVTAAAALISANDTIDIISTGGNYITAQVTVNAVTGDCTAADPADVTLTVASKSITGTAPTSSTATTIGDRTIRFNSSASTPLASQTITAGSSMTVTVQADTSNVKNGLSGSVGANLAVKINGTQGSTGSLTWGYTPSGGTAITGLTVSDSYPVNGPTFTY